LSSEPAKSIKWSFPTKIPPVATFLFLIFTISTEWLRLDLLFSFVAWCWLFGCLVVWLVVGGWWLVVSG
jgi:hypothetical protein